VIDDKSDARFAVIYGIAATVFCAWFHTVLVIVCAAWAIYGAYKHDQFNAIERAQEAERARQV